MFQPHYSSRQNTTSTYMYLPLCFAHNVALFAPQNNVCITDCFQFLLGITLAGAIRSFMGNTKSLQKSMYQE